MFYATILLGAFRINAFSHFWLYNRLGCTCRATDHVFTFCKGQNFLMFVQFPCMAITLSLTQNEWNNIDGM